MSYNDKLKKSYLSDLEKTQRKLAKSRFRQRIAKKTFTSAVFLIVLVLFILYVITQWSDLSLNQQISYVVLVLASFGTWVYLKGL